MDSALLLNLIERCEELTAEYEDLEVEWEKVPWWRNRKWWRCERKCTANLEERARILQAIARGRVEGELCPRS